MFILSTLADTVPIHPSTFSAPPAEALTSALNTKYANRVLHDVGLCVCIFDLAQAGEGKVRYGDGLLWYKVVFRVVVFRPFIGEVVVGRVKSSDEDGIRVTLSFFDDIYIPAAYLPQPSAFDPNERAWFWIADTSILPDLSTPFPSSVTPNTSAPQSTSVSSSAPNSLTQQPPSTDPSPALTTYPPSLLLDTPLTDRMYIDQGEVLRMRVEAEEFCDDEPGPPKVLEGVVVPHGAGGGRRAPFSLLCSIAEQGLGPVAWWNNAQVEEEDDGMDEG